MIYRPTIGTTCGQTLLGSIFSDAMPAPQAHAVSASTELAGQVSDIECLQTKRAHFGVVIRGHDVRHQADTTYAT